MKDSKNPENKKSTNFETTRGGDHKKPARRQICCRSAAFSSSHPPRPHASSARLRPRRHTQPLSLAKFDLNFFCFCCLRQIFSSIFASHCFLFFPSHLFLSFSPFFLPLPFNFIYHHIFFDWYRVCALSMAFSQLEHWSVSIKELFFRHHFEPISEVWTNCPKK